MNKSSKNQAKNQQLAVIATVFNEAETINDLLTGLLQQSLEPTEVIIVDGGSSDDTVGKLKNFQANHPDFPLQVLQKQSNRSVGRNYAIKHAKAELIAITDAGCIPEENWLEELVDEQRQTGAEVVAGYYRGVAGTPFEEAVVPYALVMPDQVNQDDFLPASRSMLITKKAWRVAGGFPKELNYSEDFLLARRLREQGVKMAFTKKAVVHWQPRSNLKDFYTMIFNFARGDIVAGIVRPKAILIFARYLLGAGLLAVAIAFKVPGLLGALLVGLALYVFWAITKNTRYVSQGWYWLPVLQVTSDAAVMHGTVKGLYANANRN